MKEMRRARTGGLGDRKGGLGDRAKGLGDRTGGQAAGRYLLYAAAFLIPVAVQLFLFYCDGVTPFGNNYLARDDAEIQYLDFFQYLRNVLQGEDSFLFSFSHFLGSTGIATFAYYLASPFNLLILLFEPGYETEFFSVLVLLKTAMCGLTCSIYLNKRFVRMEPVFTLLLSLCYAWMGYNAAQASNIMWLDGVYMLPLILLGTYRLAAGEGSLLFVVSLGAAIVFNWYSAYFDCIAAAAYFFYELVIRNEGREFGFRGRMKRLLMLGGHSAAGVCLSAAVFLPAVFVLLKGKGIGGFSLHNEFSGNMLNLFSGFSVGSMSAKGVLSLFCGSLVFIGVILHALDKRIPVGETCKGLLLLGLSFLMIYYEPLAAIANGFRAVDSYWYRNSYIIVAYLVILAAREYELGAAEGMDYAKAAVIAAGLMAVSYLVTRTGDLVHIGITAAVGGGLAAWVYLYFGVRRNRYVRRISCAAMAAMVLFELGYNEHLIFEKLLVSPPGYKEYVARQREQIEGLKEYDSSFYRIAQTATRGMSDGRLTANYNEPLAYNYPGITHYSSTYEREQSQLLIQLGYGKLDILPVNNTRILSSDSLLGVKYILSDIEITGLEEIPELSGYNGKKAYRNPFCLKFGILFEDTAAAVADSDPFSYQNGLFSQLMGEETVLFTEQPYIQRQGDNQTEFVVEPCGDDEIIYFYIDTDWDVDGKLYADGELLTNYSCWIAPRVVMLPKSDEAVTVTFENTGNGDCISQVRFCKLSLSALEQAVSALNCESDAEVWYEGGQVFCRVTAKEGQKLMLQIPDSESWRVTVNGKAADRGGQFADCFLVIPMEEGENSIELSYEVRGLKAGIGISLITLLAVLAMAAYGRRKRRGI